MKFVNFLLVCCFLLMYNPIWAQDIKFGKVSKAELEEKFNPLDSAAPATYLHKYRKTYFDYVPGEGFVLVNSIHHRIKIYSKDGFDYATKKIVLYKNGSTRESINRIKAITFNLVDGKIEETKLAKDGEFKVALSEFRDQKSFTMPKITEGSVIDYKYEVRSPFISNIDEFLFQHDIPVKNLVASMEAPEYFIFRLNTKGFLPIIPEKSTKETKLNFQNRVETGNYTGPRSKVQNSSLSFSNNISTYKMMNVPALKEEPYVNGMDNYRSAVSYELSYTQFPDSPRKTYSTNWEAVVNTIYDSKNFGGELKKTGYFEDEIDALVANVNGNAEKVATVLDFVKSKVKWNDNYGKYTRSGVKKAYKEGKGNVAEINLMLTAMLRHIGLDANPILVSTRANGIPLFPTREGYNYVISGVNLATGMVLLDATEAYSTPGILPFRTLNWEGRLIKKGGSSESVTLYPAKSSLRRTLVNLNLSETGEATGKIRINHKDHYAVRFRKAYFKTNEEDYLDELEKKSAQLEIDNFQVKEANNLGKGPTVSYDYSLEGASEVLAGKLYFAPMSFLRSTTNPFTTDKREFPIDFGYPSTSSTSATINIPDGYQIESLPESMSLALPEGMGAFKFMLKEAAGSIQLKVSSEIGVPVIPPTYYDSLKEYYKKMIEKMNERVVLSKV